MMRLSQGQLTRLATCPRQFQWSMLGAPLSPPSLPVLAAQEWGDRFHLLMQQRELGLLPQPLPAGGADAEFYQVMADLQAVAPDLFQANPPETLRQSEHRRTFALGDYGFTVVYDLLRLWPGRGEIVDWKTYRRLRSPEQLRQDWQTRLYCYVLAETSDLPPDGISMTYWFVRPRDGQGERQLPQWVTLPYSEACHQATHTDLTRLLERLTHWRAQAQDWPQVALEKREICDRCPFRVPCDRAVTSTLPSLDSLPEVIP